MGSENTETEPGELPEEREQTELQPVSEPAEPKKEEPRTAAPSEKPAGHVELNPADTAKKLLEPFKAILDDKNKLAAHKIREVLTAMYKTDPNRVTKYSDLYHEVRRELRTRLNVSAALVNKEFDKILAASVKDRTGEPEYPTGPLTPKGPKEPAPITGQPEGEAPPAGSTTGEPTDEPMVWTDRKVGAVMGAMINMPGWALAEWPDVTKEERDDLGKSFRDIFEEYLPTTKKAGMFMFALASIEGIMRPRIMAVIQVRGMKKLTADQAKADAVKKIREMYNVEDKA